MSDQVSQTQDSTRSRNPLFIIGLIFIALVIIVFITQKKTQIDWAPNYEKAVELARQTNKPLLMVFYKPGAPMYADAANDTYINADVKKYVEANFIPVLINVADRPDLAKKFDINYYPTHYIKQPDSDKLYGPRLGYDPPTLFIEQMQHLLDEMNNS